MSRARHSLGRAVALGLLLVAFISSAGWVVHERFLAPAASLASADAAPRPAPRARAPRPAPGEAPASESPPGEVAGGVAVLTVVGEVQYEEGQGWRPLRAGERLPGPASLRASPGAQALLHMGDAHSQLTLLEGAQLHVRQVDAALHALRLVRGRVRVDYASRGERLLRLETDGGAVAQTHGARFTVLRSGVAVAVATEAGAVDLHSAGARVRVGPGQQSVALDGEAPSAPAPIAREVLLKVARRAASASACELEGQVRPGTEVWVDGLPAEVTREGHFQVRLPRAERLPEVRVEAREPGGGVRHERIACRHSPPRPPPRQRPPRVKVEWNHAP